ncbi:hypothetical protein C8R47DRAFT_537908 [Mycena vitilis]|nr:hypothetical protein C8R47DRAFT_537908 [Mycena vitilis]
MLSPFAQHLNTNYVPTESEVKEICSHLESYTLEVSRLEALIEDLSKQRQKALNYIAAYEALVSTARRMPQDVVQEVFLACLPKQRNSVMSTKDAPLLLTRICSVWRIIALSTPALWASLHIPLEHVFDGLGEQRPLEWLERSGRCPLSLTIVGARTMEHWERFETENVDAMFQVLSGCADRWRSVELCFETTEGLSRLAGVHTPSLNSAKVYGAGPEIRELKLLTAPNLRELMVRMYRDFDNIIPQLPLRWDYLTHLMFQTVERLSPQGLAPDVSLEILRRCPSLISFKSDINNSLGNNPPDFPPQPPIILPSLQELILMRDSSSLGTRSIDFLLSNLEMPQLRRLQLPTPNPHKPSLPFLGNLAVRSPLIEHLSINLTGLTHNCLIETLSALPVLQRLVIVDSRRGHRQPDDATVQHLFAFLAEACDRPILQLLSDLYIEQCEVNDEGTMLNVARKLHDVGGHLKRLKVNYVLWVAPVAPDVLAEFAARGLAIATSCTKGGVWGAHSIPPPTTAWLGIDPSLF